MKTGRSVRLGLACAVCSIMVVCGASGQSETVPVQHPVYAFLKRMEVKGIISRYHDAVLPLGRRTVGRFLDEIRTAQHTLSRTEQEILVDYLREFQYDRTGSTGGFLNVTDPADDITSAGPAGEFSDREKFIYFQADSAVTTFANILLDVDARRAAGTGEEGRRAEYVQFGVAARGTFLGHLGYSLRATNAQFWGSRELLQEDPQIRLSHALGVTNAQNFDFAEGYVRYDGGVISAQVGRERLLWGNGYDEKMILSDNPREFDFIRADAVVKSFSYTFVHAWLLGRSTEQLPFVLPSDSSSVFSETVAADKYFAAHRFGFSFPGVVDVGFQEMAVYSNRAPDLAYLNPLTIIESSQRSRGERDNVFWAFDLQAHCIPGIELSGTLLFDDINIPDLFSDVWTNRFALQAGVFIADPAGISNTSLMVEYTRIEPYVFSHGRSREGDYGSLGMILGPRIGPNADAWSFRADVVPSRNLITSLRVQVERQGENIVDDNGTLIRNVGGDFLQPHRTTDPERRTFLDGNRVSTLRAALLLSWEPVNQIWLDVIMEYAHVRSSAPARSMDHTTVQVRVRTEL